MANIGFSEEIAQIRIVSVDKNVTCKHTVLCHQMVNMVVYFYFFQHILTSQKDNTHDNALSA